MPLSAQDMVAVLFSVPFSIIFFLLLEAQKKILEAMVGYTDNFRVFLSLRCFLFKTLLRLFSSGPVQLPCHDGETPFGRSCAA